MLELPYKKTHFYPAGQTKLSTVDLRKTAFVGHGNELIKSFVSFSLVALIVDVE